MGPPPYESDATRERRGMTTLRWPIVSALYRTELRMMLRDRRTIIMSIVLPAVVMPLMLTASRRMEERRERRHEETNFTYAVVWPGPV